MSKHALTPQARHHFTRFDQVNQLVAASEANPERGFMARMMVLCSLPRTNPGNRKEYKRVNGPYRLYMQAGPETKLPFGNLPRLILAWLLYRSGADSQPRDRFRKVAFRVHEDSGGLQQRRQSIHPAPQSNAATL